MNEDKYCFVMDDDSHWYLVPVKYLDKFNKWLEYIYEDTGYGECDGLDGDRFRIDSPFNYTFENPIEDE